MTGIVAAAAGAAAAGGSLLIDPGTQNFSATFAGGQATSGIRIANDRDIDELQNAQVIDRGDWLKSSGTPADYEVRFTLVSGTLDFGNATNTWLGLGTTREVGIRTEGVETDTAQVTVEIRRIAGTFDEISFTVNLSATEEVPV